MGKPNKSNPSLRDLAVALGAVISAGMTVRVDAAATIGGHSKEVHEMAGRDGKVLQVFPSGDMAQVEIDGQAYTFTVSELTALTDPAGGIEFVQENPALVIQSLTNPRRRKGLSIDSLNSLAENVKALGIMQPILVRKLPASRLEDTAELAPRPIYEIIAGERRWRAATIAGLPRVPLLVRDLSDEAVWEMQIAENIEREDLDPMEEAEGFELMRTRMGLTVEQISERLGRGKGTSYILKVLKLCNLTQEVREAMYDGTLGRSTGLLVARYKPEVQADVVKFIKAMAVNGEPAPFRTVAPALTRRFNLLLSEAVFDIQCLKLVAAAGACTSCPKRSSHQGDIFGNADEEDSCMDADCFDGKRKAHIQQLRDAAAKDGYKVIDADEAKKIQPYQHSCWLVGYVRLDDTSHFVKSADGEERKVTYEDALRSLGKKAPKPRMLINEETGKAVKVITQELADKLTPPDEDETDTKPEARIHDKTTPEQDALVAHGVRRACMIRLFDSIKVRPRTAEEMVHVAAAMLGAGEDLPSATIEYMGWTDDFDNVDYQEAEHLAAEKVGHLPTDELGALIVMAALERFMRQYMTKDVQEIELLEAYGVDILAVRDKVAEDMANQVESEDTQEGAEA